MKGLLPKTSQTRMRQIEKICVELVNLSAARQFRKYKKLYTELKDLCANKSKNGNADPFLEEILGDMAPSHVESVKHYLNAIAAALEQSLSCFGPALSLASEQSRKGKFQLAAKYLELARKCANSPDQELECAELVTALRPLERTPAASRRSKIDAKLAQIADEPTAGLRRSPRGTARSASRRRK